MFSNAAAVAYAKLAKMRIAVHWLRSARALCQICIAKVAEWLSQSCNIAGSSAPDTNWMTGSGISAFTDPDEFKAALAEAGTAECLVIGRGPFRARMISMVLSHLRLSSVEEWLPRIAVVSPPPGMARVVLLSRRGPCASYGGTTVEAGEIVTHISTQAVHERINGPCRWSDILLPASYVAKYGHVLTGAAFSLPSGVRRWRPAPAAFKQMSTLHAAAMRVTEARPGLAAGPEAAHGLEQELTGALMNVCLPMRCSRSRRRAVGIPRSWPGSRRWASVIPSERCRQPRSVRRSTFPTAPCAPAVRRI
jgi:hypothetical protein